MARPSHLRLSLLVSFKVMVELLLAVCVSVCWTHAWDSSWWNVAQSFPSDHKVLIPIVESTWMNWNLKGTLSFTISGLTFYCWTYRFANNVHQNHLRYSCHVCFCLPLGNRQRPQEDLLPNLNANTKDAHQMWSMVTEMPSGTKRCICVWKWVKGKPALMFSFASSHWAFVLKH